MTVAGLLLCGVVLLVTVVALATTRPRGATPLDFYLAGQRVGVVTNACAICGDYVSAASFLGVAAAVYASGIDGVWYATGFAAGFVPVLLFIAAPLRRFGRFSLPDFLGRRLGSERVRLVAVVVVQLVVLAYLVPQGVAGGLTWELLAGAGIAGLSPYATGVLLSAVVVTTLVVVGGMRGTTWTQALQFVVLLAALVWLAVAVTVDGFSYPAAVERLSQAPLRNPVLVDGVWNLQPVRSALTGAEAPSFTDPGARYGPVGQFALVLTLALGTAGLPHIVNRYFTAPSGAAAPSRRCGCWGSSAPSTSWRCSWGSQPATSSPRPQRRRFGWSRSPSRGCCACPSTPCSPWDAWSAARSAWGWWPPARPSRCCRRSPGCCSPAPRRSATTSTSGT